MKFEGAMSKSEPQVPKDIRKRRGEPAEVNVTPCAKLARTGGRARKAEGHRLSADSIACSLPKHDGDETPCAKFARKISESDRREVNDRKRGHEARPADPTARKAGGHPADDQIGQSRVLDLLEKIPSSGRVCYAARSKSLTQSMGKSPARKAGIIEGLLRGGDVPAATGKPAPPVPPPAAEPVAVTVPQPAAAPPVPPPAKPAPLPSMPFNWVAPPAHRPPGRIASGGATAGSSATSPAAGETKKEEKKATTPLLF